MDEYAKLFMLLVQSNDTLITLTLPGSGATIIGS